MNKLSVIILFLFSFIKSNSLKDINELLEQASKNGIKTINLKIGNFDLTINSNDSNAVNQLTDLLKNKTNFNFQNLLINKERFINESRKNIKLLSLFLNQNKIAISVTSFLSFHAYFIYKLFRMNILLNSKELWSCWKEELNLQKLLELPQNDLSKELINEIQKKYITLKAKDLITCINTFLNETTIELNKLNSYAKMIKWLNYLYLNKLYQINSNITEILQEKINRLTYLKNIVASSITAEPKVLN